MSDLISRQAAVDAVKDWNDRDEGLLELMSNGVNDGDPIGWLTAEEVMKYVRGGR